MFPDPRLRIIKHKGTAAGKAEPPKNKCKGLNRAKIFVLPRRGAKKKKNRIAMSNREKL